MNLGEYLKQLRGKESLREASRRIGISHTYLDTVEKGFDKRSGKNVKPTPETLKLISDAYGCDYEELMSIAGYLEKETRTLELSEKDIKDVAKTMAKLKHQLKNAKGLSFHGEPLSEEATKSLLDALEFGERTAKVVNKKYTPNKYKEKD